MLFDTNILPFRKGVYLVGGCVRDLLLGSRPSDYDLAVSNYNPARFAQQTAEKLSARVINLGKKGRDMFRVICPDYNLDISATYHNDILRDLKNRDFTLNSIAFDTNAKELVDVTGGVNDLNRKVIRMTSDSIFHNDPIRLLRAFRISANCSFVIEPETLGLIRRQSHLIHDTAPERIREEWFKILAHIDSHPTLSAMLETGLFFEMFPEAKQFRETPPDKSPPVDSSMDMLTNYQDLEKILEHPILPGDTAENPVIRSFHSKKKVLIKFALLLQHMGKPRDEDTGERKPPSGTDFPGHVLRRLKLSNREAAYLYRMVQFQDEPLKLFLLKTRDPLTSIHLIRFFMKCDEYAPDLLFLSLMKDKRKNIGEGNEFSEFVLNSLQSDYSAFKRRQLEPRLISGNDLQNIFRLDPSPAFKRILQQLEERRLAGEIQNKTEALHLVHSLLEQ